MPRLSSFLQTLDFLVLRIIMFLIKRHCVIASNKKCFRETYTPTIPSATFTAVHRPPTLGRPFSHGLGCKHYRRGEKTFAALDLEICEIYCSCGRLKLRTCDAVRHTVLLRHSATVSVYPSGFCRFFLSPTTFTATRHALLSPRVYK